MFGSEGGKRSVCVKDWLKNLHPLSNLTAS